jgi:ABC-type branched-subunit amino acid transport system substrate-binding protein
LDTHLLSSYRSIVVVCATVLALLTASCSSTEESTTTTVTGETTAATTGDAPSPTSDAPTDPSSETVTPGPLTATDTGVTESVIRIGAVFPDTTVIGNTPGDIEAKFQTIADALNEAGGINGRTIELHTAVPNPLEDAAFDAACVELTQDVEVFAVIGIFVRTTADCYGARNDTIVISTFAITEEQMASYTAPGITTVAHPSRLLEGRVAALIDSGTLAAGSKIAVHGGVATEAAHDQYVAALEAAGVEVVANTLAVGDGQDLTALQAEMEIFAERWQSVEAEAVLATSPLIAQQLLIAYNGTDVDLPMLLPEGTGVAPSLLEQQLGIGVAPFELATALVDGADQPTKYANGLEGVTECVDAFEAASGEDVALDESSDNLAPTIAACQLFDIFTAIATAAGPNLTTESFTEAAEALGPIDVTDLSAASLGPGKFDLSDSVGVLAEFNSERADFEAIG